MHIYGKTMQLCFESLTSQVEVENPNKVATKLDYLNVWMLTIITVVYGFLRTGKSIKADSFEFLISPNMKGPKLFHY